MNFQEDIKKIKRLASISEEAQELVKQITGKELVSYEGIDALVAALMGFYNGELKKKSQTGHKHTKSEITDFPVSLKNPSALTISLNGTSQGAYDGSSAKSINITAGGVGAYTKSETDTKLNGKANSTHSHTATQIAQDSSHRYVTDTEKAAWNGKLNKGSLPAKIIDAKGLYDLIESNSGLNFDTALLYLNDAGTKYANKIYFDRNKKGLFKCISQTTSTTNSTSYFVDISNEANSAQLRNLGTLKVQYENSSGTSSLITLKENMDNYTDIIFVFKYNGGVKMTQQMPVSQFKLYSFGYDMRGGENADRNYGAQILYKSNSSVQATGRITIFKVILKK